MRVLLCFIVYTADSMNEIWETNKTSGGTRVQERIKKLILLLFSSKNGLFIKILSVFGTEFG